MKSSNRQLAIAFGSGLLFAFGLALSGMTKPAKVIGFFSFHNGLESWDPSLALVMGGGMLVAFPAFRYAQNRKTALFGSVFRMPTRKDIDLRLVLGAALFGIGWGIAGYCPGPAITSISSGSSNALIVVASMIVGMKAYQLFERREPSAAE